MVIPPSSHRRVERPLATSSRRERRASPWGRRLRAAHDVGSFARFPSRSGRARSRPRCGVHPGLRGRPRPEHEGRLAAVAIGFVVEPLLRSALARARGIQRPGSRSSWSSSRSRPSGSGDGCRRRVQVPGVSLSMVSYQARWWLGLAIAVGYTVFGAIMIRRREDFARGGRALPSAHRASRAVGL